MAHLPTRPKTTFILLYYTVLPFPPAGASLLSLSSSCVMCVNPKVKYIKAGDVIAWKYILYTNVNSHLTLQGETLGNYIHVYES